MSTEPVDESSPASSSQPQQQNLEYYQCSQCHRSYSRVDHLARHVRSHLQQKPFACTVCNKGFGRPDVLKRHALSHEPENNDPKRQKRHFGQSSRVAQACKACASAKLKCEDEKPCRRCRNKNIQCDFGQDSRYPHGTPSVSQRETSQNPREGSTSTMAEEYTPVDINQGGSMQMPTPESASHQEQEAWRRATAQQGPYHVQRMPSHPLPPPTPEQMPAGTPLDMPQGYFSDFLKDVVMPQNFDPMGHSNVQHWPPQQEIWPRDVLNFTVDNSLELDPVDYGILDSFSRPPGQMSHVSPQHQQSPDYNAPQENRGVVGVGSEAFEKSSLARWRPVRDEGYVGAQKHLFLPECAEARLRVDRAIISERLNRHSRDRILAMVLSSAAQEHVPKIVASFPTAELLDDLMQRFFLWHHPRIGSWIHIHTFRPNEQPEEFLATTIAAGAVLRGTPALRKLGYALQEAERLALPKRCEESNVVTRDLWLLQSFMLDLNIGLWSGNARKMELAESHQQVITTMIRRGGKLQRPRTPPIVPLPEDTGQILREKWLKWVEQESFKRLTFHAFVHMSRSSLALLINPLIGYSELSLYLPMPAELWTAENPEKWKAIYLQKFPPHSPYRPTPALDAIRDPGTLTSIQSSIDLQYSGLIVLHGLWGMIWEFTQMSSLLKTKPPTGNSHLVLGSRHSELCQALHAFGMSLAGWVEEPSSEILLVHELLQMYLHMSLEEIQLFAGSEGKEEARRVFPILQSWIQSGNSREAVWHAAQVLRRARQCARNILVDFYALAVYHASIAFWAYGIISKATPLSGPDASQVLTELASSTPTYVGLDGNHNVVVQRFVALGRGLPSITKLDNSDQQATYVPLTDAEAVMNIAISTLKENNNGRSENGMLSPLVENLVVLMKDLGKAARGLGR